MKKSALLIVILIIALFIGAPYFTGKVAETETLKMVDVITQEPSRYGHLEVISYDRGFRSTYAQYRFTPPAILASILQSTEAIDYSCESDHGLLGIDYLCRVEGNGPYATFVKEKMNGKDPFSIHGSVSAFGKITQTYELEAHKNIELEGQMIDLPRALISIETNNDMTSFSFTGSSDTFQFADNEATLDVGNLQFKGNLTSIGAMLFTGPFELSLDKFNIKNKQESFALKQFSIATLNAENGDNMDNKAVVKIASIKTMNSLINSIENVVGAFELNGVDTKAFAEYQRASLDMQRQAMASFDAGQEPAVDPNMMLQLLPILESMLKPGLEMNFDLSAKLDGADNKFSLKSSLLEPLGFSDMAMFAINPEQILKKVDISLNTNLANSLIDADPMTSAIASQSPLLEKTSDAYKLKLAIGKKIELNGKTITFEELQRLTFASLGF